jgi:arylsulfatase
MTIISSVGPSVGYDHGSPVSERYRGQFPFEGRLHRIDIDLLRGAGEADQAGADERAAMSRQ